MSDRSKSAALIDRPCPRGVIGQRGPDGRCRCDGCQEMVRRRKKRFAERNPGKALEYEARWRTSHPEERKAAIKKWRSANPIRAREIMRKAGAKWAKSKRDFRAATRAKLRAKAISAVAPWADETAIAAFYAEARRLTDETGIVHEVDHIIPLRGKTVCGLHVESNLQVVPRSVNRKKGSSLHG